MAAKDVFNVPPIAPIKLQKRLNAEVTPLKEQTKVLTAMEWKFVQELVSADGAVTLREAAIRAGYPVKRAHATGNLLTNPKYKPHVVAAIQAYRAELGAKYGTNYERHMKDMQRIRDAALAAGAYGAAVQAEYRRGQALGTIYVERKEIRHGTIDSMSKEEVERKLDELKRIYGGPPQDILDVTAIEVGESIENDPPFDGRGELEAIPPLTDLDVPEGGSDEPEGDADGKA
jgi:phage terminase small subunit